MTRFRISSLCNPEAGFRKAKGRPALKITVDLSLSAFEILNPSPI